MNSSESLSEWFQAIPDSHGESVLKGVCLLAAGPARVTPPATSSAVATETAGKFKHFKLSILGCARVATTVTCDIQFTNVATSDRANRTFWIDGSDLYDSSGGKSPADMALHSGKTESLRGSGRANFEISKGASVIVQIRYQKVPLELSQARLTIRGSIGLSAPTRSFSWARLEFPKSPVSAKKRCE